MDRINVEELMACMHGDQDLCDKLLPLMKDAVKEGEENELKGKGSSPTHLRG